MFKKILFVSLVVLFSTTLIPKEKVFLDLVFLKGISEKVEKACELSREGKSVKSDRILKEVNKEMYLYFSKFDTFYLDKSCPLVWYKKDMGSEIGTSLECMPHVRITTVFGDTIKDNILEKIQDLDGEEKVTFSGRFKLFRSSLYSSDGKEVAHLISLNCPSYDIVDKGLIDPDEKQKIEIHASPISINK